MIRSQNRQLRLFLSLEELPPNAEPRSAEPVQEADKFQEIIEDLSPQEYNLWRILLRRGYCFCRR